MMKYWYLQRKLPAECYKHLFIAISKFFLKSYRHELFPNKPLTREYINKLLFCSQWFMLSGIVGSAYGYCSDIYLFELFLKQQLQLLAKISILVFFEWCFLPFVIAFFYDNFSVSSLEAVFPECIFIYYFFHLNLRIESYIHDLFEQAWNLL